MVDEFDSPFADAGLKWRLHDGETPHAETVRMLRSLGGSGEVTGKELLWLAYYLNEHREARHSWPGERLLHELAAMFDHHAPTVGDRETIRADLEAIERECARVAAPLADEPEVPLEAVRVEELLLPEVDRTLEIFCEEVRDSYLVDLRRQTCNCAVWPKNRSRLRHGDVRRCCSHMVEAYRQLIETEELPGVPPILRAVFADRALRGRSCDTEASWRLLKIKLRPYLVILRNHGWSYVYAPDVDAEITRYAYDPAEHRWSFGQAPIHRGAVVDWMRRELSTPG